VAGIAAVHAAFVAMAWQPAASPEAAWPKQMSMRLVANKPAGTVGAVVAPAVAAAQKPVVAKAVTAKAAKRARVAPAQKPTFAVSAEPPMALVEPAVVVTTPIQGVAFAPPVIGFGPPPARRDAPHPMFIHPPAQPMPPQAQLQAARAQVAEALSREIAAWQAPRAAQGACALSAEPEPHLACDNDALNMAIAPRESALAGLLNAWRRMEPRTQGLTIAVVDGRYQASWN